MTNLVKKTYGRNAKDELLGLIKDLPKVKCAKVIYGADYWGDDSQKVIILPVNYTAEEYEKFISELDFNYDNGYGGQELFGNVWFVDGTWCERGEYDGSEWWEYKECPVIPNELLIKNITV
jgi:hypothetical protein